MLIKEYLKESKSCLIYPESYSSKQIETAKKILKVFQDIDTNTKERALQGRLQNPNTVVILAASIPHSTKCHKPPFTLIIRKLY